MTMLTPAAAWSDVPQHETITLVLGGAGGPMNTQAQALLNRTELLLAGSTLGVQSFTVYASGTASGIYTRTTNGAAAGSVETTTSKVMLKTLDFDANTIEYAQFMRRMPKKWNLGTITAVFTWSHAATATNFGVSWGLQAAAISDADALDATLSTAIYTNDTGGVTNNAYISPATADITIAGTPTAEDLVVFQISRKADDATNDTLAIDARLHSVTIYYTAAAGTDA